MPSRQDQLHSYQFMVQRVIAALVMRETDPAQSPFRRVAGATLVGALLAALGVGGTAAYAVLKPGASGKWRNDKAIVVEAESGALFVYRDQVLHPVLNQASALLVLNAADVRTVIVPRAALAGAPRGAPLGILGAPASLPAASGLRKEPWTVCSSPEGATVFVGGRPGGGAPLGERGLLVTGPAQETYLIRNGHKHLIRRPGAALPALVWSGRPQTAVAQAFLHAVPSGADLVTPTVPERGRSVAAGTVGQLFGVRTGDRVDAFLVTAGGLASVTPLQAALLLAAPETAAVQGRKDLIPLTPAEFSGLVQGRQVVPFAADPGVGGALPADVPDLFEGRPRTVCTGQELTTDSVLPDLSRAVGTAAAGENGGVLADRVVVPPGNGALVRTDTGVLHLVTDVGRRHALPVVGVLPALGYQGQEPVIVPGEVVGLLPAGPALDPAAAAQPQ
ncbi:type VII secretion protein EccB [Dactylosporangium roseum]|uniref:Type VII secretion protein EccB n=1 Tax=Dactylosporangium roseum TaxID=47989 RepID=A0ABY5Z800_9ACTN|nr:type VII secretion protein EccB [Dactylosporangium roseum]UWZ36957.1 type VII secretion protein EccB [Dactylosporangium roseum]